MTPRRAVVTLSDLLHSAPPLVDLPRDTSQDVKDLVSQALVRILVRQIRAELASERTEGFSAATVVA